MSYLPWLENRKDVADTTTLIAAFGDDAGVEAAACAAR